MENFFKKALSLNVENEADSFLAFAITHTTLKVKILKKEPQETDLKKQAQLFNAFFENGFNYTDYKFLGNKLIQEILNSFASKNGIEPPTFEILKTSCFNNSIAIAKAKNSVQFCRKEIVGQHKFNGQSFGKSVNNIAHESQHLKQFFYTRKFLQGKDVDIQYKIMAFQQIFEFCGITTSKLDFFKNDKYWFNAMEIDARKTGAEFVLNLIENPFLSYEAKKNLVYFTQSQLEESSEMFNSGKNLLKQLNYQINTFEKMFKDVPLAKSLSSEFHKLEPQIQIYAKSLNDFGCKLPYKIMKIREIQKKQKKAEKHQSKILNN